jgi:hypothetical protein
LCSGVEGDEGLLDRLFRRIERRRGLRVFIVNEFRRDIVLEVGLELELEPVREMVSSSS